jgi:hypothetical protein
MILILRNEKCKAMFVSSKTANSDRKDKAEEIVICLVWGSQQFSIMPSGCLQISAGCVLNTRCSLETHETLLLPDI